MSMSWGEGHKTLDDFLESDLPFLLNSHYDDTVSLLEQSLDATETSLIAAISRYPNLLLKIKYNLFFWFSQQMSTVHSNENSDFYNHYCVVARAYQEDYINKFVAQQVAIILEQVTTKI